MYLSTRMCYASLRTGFPDQDQVRKSGRETGEFYSKAGIKLAFCSG